MEFVRLGYEGSVIKNLDSPYNNYRTNNWLKYKVIHTHDYKILSVNSGQGRLSNTMGYLEVDIDGVPTRVGSGFSDDDRDWFWNNKSSAVGNYIEIQFQNKSINGSLIFPVFVRYRDDK